MSHITKMTILGMYEYDEHLFDDLVLPMGLNKDIFINTVMLNYGEKPTLYTSVSFMRTAIEMWGIKWFDSISRIARALSEEYNPIHNFDRHEDYEDNETNNSKTYANGSTETTTSNESTVSAYNSSTYQPDSKNTISASDESINNGSYDGTRNLKHNAHLYGNIGVTKSQEMVMDEINLRSNHNVYDAIAELFSSELLLYIY